MKKVLLLGGQGMLGSEIFTQSLEMDTVDVIPFSRFNLDLTKETEIVKKLQKFIDDNSIDVVINASAYTVVDKCEEGRGEEQSFAINAVAPKYIVEACKEKNIPLFHFSTDYVFSGDTNQSFNENDDPDIFPPINMYGKHKLQGEKEVLQYEKGFVLRTAWLSGQFGHNFVNKIVHLLKTAPQIKVVKNEWGSPSFTTDVASHVLRLVTADTLPENSIFHVVNERGDEYKGGVSRVEFVEEIRNFLGFDTPIIPVKTFNFVAKRPISSVLNNNYGEKLPDWKTALHALLAKEKEKIEKKRQIAYKKEQAREKYRAQQEQLRAEKAEQVACSQNKKEKENK